MKLFPYTATTPAGPIRGIRHSGVDAYLGIPFAMMSHRFAAPSPVEPWAGVREATEHGPAPEQNWPEWFGPRLSMAEDCLNLAVWTPAGPTAGLPVVVWLYGGGFEGGTNALPAFDGAALALAAGCVVVSPNYRVGALGFASLVQHDDPFAFSSNLGVRDVIAALSWVRRNVAGFGGDPGAVTVMGQSAGGFIAAALLAAREAAGLFQRLALFSGGSSRLAPLDTSESMGDALLTELGLGEVRDVLDVPVSRILDAQGRVVARDIGDRNGRVPAAYGVVLDARAPHPVISEHPADAVARGAARAIDIWSSATRDEVALFRSAAGADFEPRDEKQLRDHALRWGVPVDRVDAILAHYTADADSLGQARERVLTDWIYRLPALRLARLQAEAGGRVWLSETSRVGTAPAAHGADVPALFARASAFDDGTRRRDRAITDALVDFINTGSPGWPQVTPSNWNSRAFTGEGTTDMSADTAQLHDLWDGVERP